MNELGTYREYYLFVVIHFYSHLFKFKFLIYFAREIYLLSKMINVGQFYFLK